ncbi:TolC family protein [Arcobacter defluvii]|uniref:RND family efflux system, outer membrane channel protein, TolC family n=1 Tax=Arcobacter defluvii TaxID=873191 RepID=A0AAE7E5K1_9BACT|nr:TolC family protein [Arcobacter defluvii]QKF76895.1 RND family efflux system, outer membrane channel protein, TolC family [Arcobacter defluvii]RXI33768.1 transporter [Arcobacter defluvii]
MRKIIVCSLFCSLAFANNLDILQKDKKESRELEKKYIESNYESNKNDWISPINLNSSLNRSHSISSDNDKFSKSVSIGFTQSIYESGGIEFTIQYAKDKLKYDLLSWENQNSQLLESIYDTLLEISKLKLQIEQSRYKLENKDIELIIKKIQYEAGRTDIVELNNAIMAKNTQFKDNISLENSLKDKEYELSKYTDLKYDEIEILDFKNVSKEDFINYNLDFLQEDSKVEMLNTSYKKTKTNYLPKVSLGATGSYSNIDDLIKNANEDETSASASLTLLVPLYDYNKSNKLQDSKLEYLKQRSQVNDLKNEIAYEYEQILNQIDTYEKYNKTIDDNIKLYNELISANISSNEAGMTSVYDLDILKNTKKINEYDMLINDINIKLEYSKLYFKIKG